MIPDITSPLLLLAVWIAAGYLIGSIPFGIVIARALGLGDLRKIGSGNIGATNVLRTGSKVGAFLTLVLDAGKAGLVALAARWMTGDDAGQAAGLAAFVGHCFPVYLAFKGGKGVATFFGLLFALAWPVAIATGATWLIVAFALRYSSLAALVAVGLTPLWAWVLGMPSLIGLSIILIILVFWRHTDNIKRLIAGTESKIGN